MSSSSRLATLLVLAFAALPSTALAQYSPAPPPGRPSAPARSRLELTAIAGYQLNTDVNTTGGELSVDDAPVYGVALSKETFRDAYAELLWLYSEPSVTTRSTTLGGAAPFDVPTHYFQIGGTKGVTRDRLQIFGGATIGAALFLPGTIRYGNGTTYSLDDTWRFAFTLGAGFKVDLSPRVALRFDARLAAPVYFTSGSFYAGSGGAGASVSGGVPIWQWNFLGGLAFRP
jgi:opacity protein-like surface antigen